MAGTGSSIKERQRSLLEEELHCDVSFEVGEAREIICGHKMILAQRSPVFEKMLFGPLAEPDYPVTIPDVEPAAFRAVMR